MRTIRSLERARRIEVGFFLMALGVNSLWASSHELPGSSHYIDTTKIDLAALECDLFWAINPHQEENLRRLEQRVLESVNKLRVKKGLRPLQMLESLSKIARDHSESMALWQYFSHTDLNGRKVSGRLKLAGVRNWQICGENIASNRGQRDPVKTAIDGWLASSPHAAMMLKPDFTHTGIGVAKGLDESYYFTQLFIK